VARVESPSFKDSLFLPGFSFLGEVWDGVTCLVYS